MEDPATIHNKEKKVSDENFIKLLKRAEKEALESEFKRLCVDRLKRDYQITDPEK